MLLNASMSSHLLKTFFKYLLCIFLESSDSQERMLLPWEHNDSHQPCTSLGVCSGLGVSSGDAACDILNKWNIPTGEQGIDGESGEEEEMMVREHCMSESSNSTMGREGGLMSSSQEGSFGTSSVISSSSSDHQEVEKIEESTPAKIGNIRRESGNSGRSDDEAIPAADELYEVTLTTGNIDIFSDLFNIKQLATSTSSIDKPEELSETSNTETTPPCILPFPWPVNSKSCNNKTCKKFNVQPSCIASSACDSCDFNTSHSDSNIYNPSVLSKSFSSESRLVASPAKRRLSHQEIPVKPTILPLKSDDNSVVLPFPWSSTSPVEAVTSPLNASASSSNLLPWETPSEPVSGRLALLHSPSVSYDLDSICPQVSSQSMRLSEVESHQSHHSEPFPHYHQVLDVPARRATELEGSRIEFDLGNDDDDEEEDPRVRLHDRVMKWMELSEAAMNECSDQDDDDLDIEFEIYENSAMSQKLISKNVPVVSDCDTIKSAANNGKHISAEKSVPPDKQ